MKFKIITSCIKHDPKVARSQGKKKELKMLCNSHDQKEETWEFLIGDKFLIWAIILGQSFPYFYIS